MRILPLILMLGFSFFRVFAEEVKTGEETHEGGTNCWSATADPTVQRMLTPQSYKMPDGHIVRETSESISQMNQLIWSHRDVIDPRLVYYRMFGESDADPFIHNQEGSGAYGMFQFLGNFYKESSHKSQILKRYKDQPNKSPRLIQLEYYLDHYVAVLRKNTDNGQGGCHPTKWNKLTAVQKISYLGWGNCKKSSVTAERSLCKSNHGYIPDACMIAGPLVAGATVQPVCAQP